MDSPLTASKMWPSSDCAQREVRRRPGLAGCRSCGAPRRRRVRSAALRPTSSGDSRPAQEREDGVPVVAFHGVALVGDGHALSDARRCWNSCQESARVGEDAAAGIGVEPAPSELVMRGSNARAASSARSAASIRRRGFEGGYIVGSRVADRRGELTQFCARRAGRRKDPRSVIRARRWPRRPCRQRPSSVRSEV